MKTMLISELMVDFYKTTRRCSQKNSMCLSVQFVKAPDMGLQMFYGASYSSADYAPCWFRKARSRRTYKITSIFIPAISCRVNKTDSKAGLVSDKGGGSGNRSLQSAKNSSEQRKAYPITTPHRPCAQLI